MRNNIMRRTTRQHSPEPTTSAQNARIGSADRRARLTLVSRYNDDGHFSGLEPTWISLDVAVGLALSRGGERR